LKEIRIQGDLTSQSERLTTLILYELRNDPYIYIESVDGPLSFQTSIKAQEIV